VLPIDQQGHETKRQQDTCHGKKMPARQRSKRTKQVALAAPRNAS